MVTALSVFAAIITVVSALWWIYRERHIVCQWLNGLHHRTTAVGIRRPHPNRKCAINQLYKQLESSSLIRVMNLKGYSLVEEGVQSDTLLHRLLNSGNGARQVEVLLHFPDSIALNRRAQELGRGYSVESMRAEHRECVRKIRDIRASFTGRVTLRYFSESIALWSIIIWDNGILVGWYGKGSHAHTGWSLELKRDSELGRQFEKYFDSIWRTGSLSEETYCSLVPLFPTSGAYPSDIAMYESLLSAQYGRTPSQENAFVIMIGGGAGTGKSTLAWQLADILGVRNVISTDMVRQTMRMDSNAPQVLLDETWEAWRRVGSEKTVDTLYAGLKAQADLLGKPLVSLAEYALSKGMPTIIEGVHILPNSEIAALRSNRRCILFFVDAPEEQIDANFKMRKYSTHMRRIRDEFSSLDDRIALHDRMLKLARENGLSVVQGSKWDALIRESVQLIGQHLSQSEQDARTK